MSVMDLVIWTYIFGGATLFGLIVGVFSVWNGRMTRRDLKEFIERSARDTQAILTRMDEHMRQMDERHTQVLARIEEHMKQMDEHMKRMDERHTQFLERISEKVAHL